MYVYKEVLSVSTRKGTNICEFAEHRFIYTSIYDMICVFLSMYVRIETGLRNLITCQGRVRRTWVHIQKCL